MKQPEVSVGIVTAVEMNFTLHCCYTAKGEKVEGSQHVAFHEGGILWNGQLYQELAFTPQCDDASFTLEDVTIGLHFHWERKEQQRFIGKLRLVIHESKICAINILPVEEYLISVISSEMNATSKLEFLKAHAVISRSWLLAQIEKRNHLQDKAGTDFFSFQKSEGGYVRWYDREDHTIFDVCADDHCQRYQGITKATNPTVAEAVYATKGQVLMFDNKICDARFSKCCGGISEEFNFCWEDKTYPYLKAIQDIKTDAPLPDLQSEENAREWILGQPDAFCNTKDKRIISQILNNFDQETTDFYRWTVEYTQEELTQLIQEKSKYDFGDILDIEAVERGKSGRISKLRITGTKKTLVIGKELEIRRILSKSHLFSSAFVIEKEGEEGGLPQRFRLRGAGWGHGVGLCQIGAAVMGEQGYNYQEILQHYYRNAAVKAVY